MKSLLRAWFGVLSVIALATGCHRAPTRPSVETWSLANGIQVVVVNFPASTNVSIFTLLPLGLASDAPDQAQWSHLVEHLVIRSTVPVNSLQANAETLPDHMRLDFYGNTGNWLEGLAHHRRWLEGVPFSETNLAAEKIRATRECDSTARTFSTHKFAVAAWSHGLRHGKKHVALKADVMRAQLEEIQRLRDTRLAVPNHVTVCIVGGLDPKIAFAQAQKELSSVRLHGVLPKPSGITISNPKLDLTWDLDARHLLITWPIPDFHHRDYPALMVAAQKLNLQFSSDAELAKTGMTFANADLTTPEGSYLFVSMALKPGADFDAMRQRIMTQVERLTAPDDSHMSEVIGRQLGPSLEVIMNPEAIKANAPGVSLALIEGNVGLQRGMYEYRYGEYRPTLAKALAAVNEAAVNEAARKYLTADKAIICTIRPAAGTR